MTTYFVDFRLEHLDCWCLFGPISRPFADVASLEADLREHVQEAYGKDLLEVGVDTLPDPALDIRTQLSPAPLRLFVWLTLSNTPIFYGVQSVTNPLPDWFLLDAVTRTAFYCPPEADEPLDIQVRRDRSLDIPPNCPAIPQVVLAWLEHR